MILIAYLEELSFATASLQYACSPFSTGNFCEFGVTMNFTLRWSDYSDGQNKLFGFDLKVWQASKWLLRFSPTLITALIFGITYKPNLKRNKQPLKPKRLFRESRNKGSVKKDCGFREFLFRLFNSLNCERDCMTMIFLLRVGKSLDTKELSDVLTNLFIRFWLVPVFGWFFC